MFYIFIPIIVIFLIWLICYLKNNQVLVSLPYLIILFITPIYEILDKYVFLKIFGCVCVPLTQKNMLNIPFNANDLRLVIFSIFLILDFIYSQKLAKSLKKENRLVNLASIIIVNVLLIILINNIFKWS